MAIYPVQQTLKACIDLRKEVIRRKFFEEFYILCPEI